MVHYSSDEHFSHSHYTIATFLLPHHNLRPFPQLRWLVRSSGIRFKATGAILNQMIPYPGEQNTSEKLRASSEREREREGAIGRESVTKRSWIWFSSRPFPLIPISIIEQTDKGNLVFDSPISGVLRFSVVSSLLAGSVSDSRNNF